LWKFYVILAINEMIVFRVTLSVIWDSHNGGYEEYYLVWYYAMEAGILLGLFDSEDGGDVFLRNVGSLSTDFTALYPRTLRSYSRLE
jgi:hypothetical protein